LYVPSIGFSIFSACVLEKYFKRHIAAMFLAFTVVTGVLGYKAIDKIPDGRTSVAARAFLDDLNNIIRDKEEVRGIYVRHADTYIYQVLWYGEAFDTFLERPVPVTFDFQDPSFQGESHILEVTYDGERLRESVRP
jgi:hypothetical protein